MYPDLSYLFHDLFGTAPDNWTAVFKTFGLCLGMAFFASAFVLYKEFKRKEREGLLQPLQRSFVEGKGVDWIEVLISSFIGFSLGYKLLYIRDNFDRFKVDPSEILFSGGGYLFLGVGAALLLGGFTYWQGHKSKLDKPRTIVKDIYPSQKVGDITMQAMIFGLLGAKVFNILENGSGFWEDPIGTLFSGSGLTVYGGLILGFFGVIWYLKRNQISVVHFLDACSPAYIAGYGVGRIGCQLSGDGDWGIVNNAAKPDWFFFPDWMWSYDYPRNVLERGIPVDDCVGRICNRLPEGVFPTPFYEIVLSVIIFMILWSMRKRIKTAGVMFFSFCIFNGLERFFIEKIRVNESYNYFGFEWSQAQYIAIAILMIGVIGLVYLFTKKPKAELT